MINAKAAKAVRNGVTYLDKQYSREDWTSRIDWEGLDLSDAGNCVGGQIESDYWEFRRKHDLGLDELCMYGFSTGSSKYGNEELTKAWKDWYYTQIRVEKSYTEIVELLTEMNWNRLIEAVYGDRIKESIETLMHADDDSTTLAEIRRILG